jgi:hypothetical protein
VSGFDPGLDGSTGRHPVDWDLLADHLAGVLDGTPEGARLAGLVATDPAWAQGAAELAAVLDVVSAELAAVPRITMPADISARLEGALAGAPAPDTATGTDVGTVVATAPGPAADAPSVRRPVSPGADGPTGPGRSRPGGTVGTGGTGPGGTGPDGSRPGDGRPGGRGSRGARQGAAGRRRLARWAASLTVAAGVVAFGAFGLNTLIGGSLTGAGDDGAANDSGVYRTTQEDGDAAPAPADGDPGATMEETGAPVLTATGLDHDATTLPRTEIARGSELAPQASRSTGEDPPASALATLDPALVPPALIGFVADPDPLDRCLAAVAREAGVARASIYLVDLARFDGEPAVVMWLRDPAGTTGVWVSGPACGTPAGNTDNRFADLTG